MSCNSKIFQNALKSLKLIKKGSCWSRHFSVTWFRQKIWSLVGAALSEACLVSLILSLTASFTLVSMIVENTFPPMSMSVMPDWCYSMSGHLSLVRVGLSRCSILLVFSPAPKLPCTLATTRTYKKIHYHQFPEFLVLYCQVRTPYSFFLCEQ